MDVDILSANLTEDDDLFLKIWRQGTNELDTFDNTAKLLSVHIHFTMDKLGQTTVA